MLMSLVRGGCHRFQIDRLESGLLFLELVKRGALLREHSLKPRREVGPLRVGRLPRQGVTQAIAVQAVLQGMLAKPTRHRLSVRNRSGETGDEAPALPGLAAKLVERSVGDHDPA